jgi:hypothetical protein
VKLRFHSLAAAVVAAAFLAAPLRADDSRACPAIDPPLLRPSFAKASEGFGGQAASSPGLRVFRDPETGQWRQPTREEAAELARAEAEAAPEAEPVFVVVEHSDGMKSVDLQGALMQSIVVTRNPDGSLTFRCVPARLAAAASVSAAPAPQARPALEEK